MLLGWEILLLQADVQHHFSIIPAMQELSYVIWEERQRSERSRFSRAVTITVSILPRARGAGTFFFSIVATQDHFLEPCCVVELYFDAFIVNSFVLLVASVS